MAYMRHFSVQKEDNMYWCLNMKTLLLKGLLTSTKPVYTWDTMHSQYDCEHPVIDNDRINRGFTTKPIIFEKVLEDNTIKDKKSSKLYAKIATVPEGIEKDAEFDVNIIVLKEGKYACRTIIKKAVECKKASYQAKINYKPDYANKQ